MLSDCALSVAGNVEDPQRGTLVREHVTELRKWGSPEVAFRVAVVDGRVSFTARALKGVRTGE